MTYAIKLYDEACQTMRPDDVVIKLERRAYIKPSGFRRRIWEGRCKSPVTFQRLLARPHYPETRVIMPV